MKKRFEAYNQNNDNKLSYERYGTNTRGKNHAKLVLNPFLHKEMFYKTTHFVGD